MAALSSITIAKFWSKVTVGTARVCWPWHGQTDEHGYGRFRFPDGTETKAHRLAWSLVNGPIPDAALVLHSCDNPPCCNPRHLRPGTAQDNSDDCWSRERGVRLTGLRNGRAKLTDEQVAAIRDDGRKGAIIAAEYGISQSLVSMLRKGERRAVIPSRCSGRTG